MRPERKDISEDNEEKVGLDASLVYFIQYHMTHFFEQSGERGEGGRYRKEGGRRLAPTANMYIHHIHTVCDFGYKIRYSGPV